MTRFLWPTLMLGMTVYVWNHNQTNTGSKLLFPLIETLAPGTAGDPAAMGEASVWAFGACTALFFAWELWKTARSRPTEPD